MGKLEVEFIPEGYRISFGHQTFVFTDYLLAKGFIDDAMKFRQQFNLNSNTLLEKYRQYVELDEDEVEIIPEPRQ